jgi:hypothetical protein
VRRRIWDGDEYVWGCSVSPEHEHMHCWLAWVCERGLAKGLLVVLAVVALALVAREVACTRLALDVHAVPNGARQKRVDGYPEIYRWTGTRAEWPQPAVWAEPWTGER